jgi:phosphatidate cytidylyltransferase
LSLYATPMKLGASTGATIIATVLVGVFIVTLLWHSRDAQVQGVIAAAGATMIAVVLLGIMLGFYLAIRRWHSAWVVLAVILITKSGDIGAYVAGRACGRHKLIPWLSPKKTWEGLAGAVALATGVAAGFAWLSQVTDLAAVVRTDHGAAYEHVRRYSVVLAAVAGALLALVGHAGDLMVSLFKRDAGVKDAGRAIPGFGGLLDLLDSPLLVAPVAYWMLAWAAGGE